MVVGMLLIGAAVAAPSLTVKTEFGEVQGTQKVVNNVNVQSWLGVPFGAAPVGSLRWKPPTNPQPWTVAKVTGTPFKCLQTGFNGKFSGDENTCLQANIWVPAGTSNTPIDTVMVWIHGGGNTDTMPSENIFEGSNLVARSANVPADQSERVIMVAIGYRMGGLGFMAMPELTAESPDKSSGNYGLLDQIFALKWVKRNIQAFGASKNPKVVVFGESAGAYDIATLLASPLATGLFDGAIMESTYQSYYWKTLSVAEKTGTDCAAMHNCQKSGANETIKCMRALPAQDAYNCMAKTLNSASNQLELLVTPNVDNHVLKCDPIEGLEASAKGSTKCGKLSQAPIMVGSSLREGNIFATDFVSGTSPWGTDVTAVGLTAAQSIIDLFQSGKTVDASSFQYVLDVLYPVKDYEKVAENLNVFFSPLLKGQTLSAINATTAQLAMGDLMFTCSASLTAAAIASAKQTTRNSYLYLFNHTPSNEILSLLGPTHTSEMPYIFGTFDKYAEEISSGLTKSWVPTTYEIGLSNTMMDYWLNFARYQNPNGPNTKGTASTWPAASCGDQNNFMVFGNKDTGAVASVGKPYHHNSQCALWQSFAGLDICITPTTKPATKSPNAIKVPTGVVVGVSVTIILLVVAVVAGAVIFLMIRRKQNEDGGNADSLDSSYAKMDQ